MQEVTKKQSFFDKMSAKFTKTFAEKFPEEVRQNIEEKVSDSVPYIIAGVAGGLIVHLAARRILPFKRTVSSITVINNYYK